MMVLIDRKFIDEQLLLKTFFPKMHIERGIRKKTNTFFSFHIYFHVIDNSLYAYSHCCQISYFMACTRLVSKVTSGTFLRDEMQKYQWGNSV